MKKLSLNFALLLATLMAVLSGCSKSDVTPAEPSAKTNKQELTVTAFLVKSYMFLRMPGPLNLGHTGVGYEVREMSGTTVTKVYTYCGGIENPNGWAVVAPGGYNGGWVNYDLNSNVSMLNRMRAKGYNSYKFETTFRSVPQSWLTGASDMIRYFPYRGYRVAENNCANGVYDVLSWLRAPSLVLPYFNWAPKDQYNKAVTGWSTSRAL